MRLFGANISGSNRDACTWISDDGDHVVYNTLEQRCKSPIQYTVITKMDAGFRLVDGIYFIS